MSTESQSIVFRKSKRVVLRPVLESDIPLLMKWINDPEVSQYLNAHLPMMEADEREWFENLHKRKPNNIVLIIEIDGKPIGNMGLHGISFKDGTATTGALIGEKDFWGKGYGSEAKMLLLDYAFNTLNLTMVLSRVLAFNERSYKYSIKCGYKEEARIRELHFHAGKRWDELILVVRRNDWLHLWEKFAKEHGLPLY